MPVSAAGSRAGSEANIASSKTLTFSRLAQCRLFCLQCSTGCRRSPRGWQTVVMVSFADVLWFFPMLCCSILAQGTSAYYSLWMSGLQFIANRVCQAITSLCKPFNDLYNTVINTLRMLLSYCWASWKCICTVLTCPVVVVMDTVQFWRVTVKYCQALVHWLTVGILTIATTPLWVAILASCTFSNIYQVYSKWAEPIWGVPMRDQSSLVQTRLRRRVLQLLWTVCPGTCQAVYTWLSNWRCGIGTQGSPEPQVRHTLNHLSFHCLLTYLLCMLMTGPRIPSASLFASDCLCLSLHATCRRLPLNH